MLNKLFFIILTLSVIFCGCNMTDSSGDTEDPVTPTAPVLSIDAGVYYEPVSITISVSGDFAIHYTIDGSTPDASSSLYNGAITINSDTVLKAIAINGNLKSIVVEASFVFDMEAGDGIISLNSGVFNTNQNVTITPDDNTAVYYTFTTDGTEPADPTKEDNIYNESLSLTTDVGTETIYRYKFKSFTTASAAPKSATESDEVMKRSWTIDKQPPAVPTVSGPDIVSNNWPAWSWNIPTDTVSFRYQLDSESGTWTETTDTLTVSFSPPAALNAGTHTLFVQAVDKAGNISNSGSKAINIESFALAGEYTMLVPMSSDTIDNPAHITLTGTSEIIDWKLAETEDWEADVISYDNDENYIIVHWTTGSFAPLYQKAILEETDEHSYLFSILDQYPTYEEALASTIEENFDSNSFICQYEEGSTAMPSIWSPPGTYISRVNIAFSCWTDDAEIYFTTDGTDPDSSSTLYTGGDWWIPLLVGEHTVKAIAISPTLGTSHISTAHYSVEPMVIDTEYLITTPGFGIRYQVSDDSAEFGVINDTAWAVVLDTGDEYQCDINVDLETDATQFARVQAICDRDEIDVVNLLNGSHPGIFIFYAACSVPLEIADGITWSEGTNNEIELISSYTVGSVTFDDCFRVNYSHRDDQTVDNYNEGSGYYILQRNLGLVYLEYTRDYDSSTICFSYLEHTTP